MSITRIGLLGCGTVGGALARQLLDQRAEIERRTGLQLELAAVAVRNASTPRDGVPAELLTTDAASVVAADDIDLVVETMGGTDPTRELVLTALAAGKPVVTANKELLASHGPELYRAAERAGVDLLFEASVAAGIPLIRPIRESLIGEPVARVMGIVNGTTNFILSQMAESGAGYAESLGEAQALGYAEADPTADVEGLDAGAKTAILATHAFGRTVSSADVHTEGISTITADDITNASHRGFVIKLLGVAEQHADGSIGVRVHPAMLPIEHPLASVRDAFNAVFVEGPGVDQLMFFGRGAGGDPTAAMMLGDVIDAAQNVAEGTSQPFGTLPAAEIRPIGELETAYYISVDCRDEPGVLAAIAATFGDHGVSIKSMEQEGLGDEARLTFITHIAVESALRSTLDDLGQLDVVKNVGQVLRVIGGD